MANRKTKKDWGTILLQMALDARQEGDLVTAELLVAHAMDYFGNCPGCIGSSTRSKRVDHFLRVSREGLKDVPLLLFGG